MSFFSACEGYSRVSYCPVPRKNSSIPNNRMGIEPATLGVAFYATGPGWVLKCISFRNSDNRIYLTLKHLSVSQNYLDFQGPPQNNEFPRETKIVYGNSGIDGSPAVKRQNEKNHALCDTSMKLGAIAGLYELNISDIEVLVILPLNGVIRMFILSQHYIYIKLCVFCQQVTQETIQKGGYLRRVQICGRKSYAVFYSWNDAHEHEYCSVG